MNKDQLGALKTSASLHQQAVSEAGTLPPYLKRAIVAPDAGAFEVALSPAAINPGHIIHIVAPDVADGGTTTVATVTGAKGGNLVLDADGDSVILWSDGVEWLVLVDGIA